MIKPTILLSRLLDNNNTTEKYCKLQHYELYYHDNVSIIVTTPEKEGRIWYDLQNVHRSHGSAEPIEYIPSLCLP